MSRKLTTLFPIATITDDARGAFEQDDLVEITLAGPPYDQEHAGEVLRIRINAWGVIDCSETVECHATSQLLPNQWDLEAAIPLQVVQSFSRFNLAIVSPSADLPRLAWSVTYGSPQDASRFGDISLEGTSP